MKLLRSQKGVSLVAAIFILIVLSTLGAYMVTVGGTNRATSSAALQGARAYQAARSGIAWSAYLITSAADQAAARNSCDNIIDANSFTLNADGLVGFTINATCEFTPHSQQGDDITVYVISSTATSGGNYGDLDFVQRRLRATISPP